MKVSEMIPALKKQAGRKRSARQALALCGILLIAGFLCYQYLSPHSKQKVPRVGDFIHLGHIYWVSDSPDGSIINCDLIMGGEARRLAQLPHQTHIQLLDHEQTYSPDAIVYSTYAYLPIPPTNAQGGGSPGTRTDNGVRYNLGVFHAARQKSMRDPSFHEYHWAPSLLPEITPVSVQAVDIHTSAIHELATLNTRSPSLVVAGKQLYWIKYLPDDTVSVIHQDKTWNEVMGHCELWVTSLTDHSSRCLSTGLLAASLLHAGTEGVFWAEPNSYPDGLQTLYYWHEKDSRLYRIADFTGSISDSCPVEYQGRLYWFDSNTPGPYSNTNPWKADRLVSANLDGSDKREVFSLKERNLGVPSFSHESVGPRLYEGDLYCLFNDLTVLERRMSLCRIRPERPDPVEVVYPLKKNEFLVALDEQYVYCCEHTEQRSLWSVLTGDTTIPKLSEWFYRMKLPRN